MICECMRTEHANGICLHAFDLGHLRYGVVVFGVGNQKMIFVFGFVDAISFIRFAY